MNSVSFLSLKASRFSFLVLALSLEVVCLTLIWRANDMGHFAMSILFLSAVGVLIWEKRYSLECRPQVLSSLAGLGLIIWVLWQGLHPTLGDGVRLLSFTSAVGVALLMSGFGRLKQYWQELLILFFLGVPGLLLKYGVDIAPLTAKFSALLLWYSGFDVSTQGIHISLPGGGIEVVRDCAGIDTIAYVLGISVIALVMLPVQRYKIMFVPLVAIALGFIVNAIRVAMLAVLVSSNRPLFESLHGGTASYFYGSLGIILFGLFYQFLLRQEERAEYSTHSTDESL